MSCNHLTCQAGLGCQIFTYGDTSYVTKDSGRRGTYDSGMVRDIQDGKPRYDLIDRAFLTRWAALMERGAVKYGDDNWRKAETEVELKRFQASALRHMFQWLEGDRTEDHAVAVAFNLAGAEMVRGKLEATNGSKSTDGGENLSF